MKAVLVVLDIFLLLANVPCLVTSIQGRKYAQASFSVTAILLIASVIVMIVVHA